MNKSTIYDMIDNLYTRVYRVKKYEREKNWTDISFKSKELTIKTLFT